MDLPKSENEILDFWDTNKIFEKSLENRKDKPGYSFYDGPPFATGTPHYGHIVASTMKDAVPRYWTMKGYHVPRVWGWDCHGLPIENIAEKELGITEKKQIEELGVAKFNEVCASKVTDYVEEWKRVIRRLGRWADMENAYKTMDPSYMESVWWVFKSLWDKGLVYESYRAMHICPRCETTLSQSEVAEGYKDVKDLSAIAKFELIDETGTYVLAWTTTPWTLIGNVALAVGNKIRYVKIATSDEEQGTSERYILAKERLADVLKAQKYEIVEEFDGSDLVGKSYKPLFDYYSSDEKLKNRENGWKVYSAPFVTVEDGTGVVHIAPAFGEDDMKLGLANNLPFVQHIGMDGVIKPEAKEFAGLHVKPIDDVQATDVEIIKYLAHAGLLFAKEKFEHSYPHCWRCDTPLLNYATTSWFVGVEKIKPEALELAKKINWSPKYIKDGRFGNWLEGARDWSISRQRYWASVIPLWKCDKCGEMKVIGSLDELRKSSKQKITKIIFVRHAESEKNVQRINSHSVDKWPLTEKGRREATELSNKITSGVDVIISSPILRARETAEILNESRGLEIVFNNDISEYQYGEWNDIPKDELIENNESYQDYKKITDLDEKFAHKLGKSGESRAEIVQRAQHFIDHIKTEYAGKTIMVVSHGGINAAIQTALHNSSAKEYFKHEKIGHNQIEEIYIDENGKPFDLHKDKIDPITFDCEKCDGTMKRIPDVLDTWFDSGSMPYAQSHYPFENKEETEKTFPAEFIAEGIDQTRAWFYYLHVIATAIKQDVAYKNVIVNGIVLAEDGKKMSKRLNNYPDPTLIFDKYGADVLRYYLLTSPVMQAENINFNERELAEIQRGVFRMLWNSYSFFVMYANVDKWEQGKSAVHSTQYSVLDQWIISELNILVRDVNESMTKYELTKAVRLFAPFIDNLSNWYIRRSRKRFWKSENDDDKAAAYHTLYEVLITLAKLLAPFAPFIAEEIYRNLTGMESVHLTDYPETNADLVRSDLSEQMDLTRKIVELGLSERATAKIKVRQPLQSLSYSGTKIEPELESIIAEEVNLKEVRFANGDDLIIKLNTEISNDLKLEGYAREIIRNVQSLRKESGFQIDDRITVEYSTESSALSETISKFEKMIADEVLAVSFSEVSNNQEVAKEFAIDDEKILVAVNVSR